MLDVEVDVTVGGGGAVVVVLVVVVVVGETAAADVWKYSRADVVSQMP